MGTLEELEVVRYGKQFKDKAVARLLPPENSAIEVISREIGISVGILKPRPSRDAAVSRTSIDDEAVIAYATYLKQNHQSA